MKELGKSNKNKNIKQPNHLELLERAALYGPYSMSLTLPADTSEHHYNSIEESISIISPKKRGFARDKDHHLYINLQSFHFHQSPKSGSTYYLEVTMGPNTSFHTTTSFNGHDSTLNYQKKIKLSSQIEKYLTHPDHPIRFSLVEKPQKKHDPHLYTSPSTSVSSSPRDQTLTESGSLVVQGKDIAYGSLKYSSLVKSLTDVATDKEEQWTTTHEVPFFATRYSHPEIGKLNVRFMIDGGARFWQLLTNAKP